MNSLSKLQNRLSEEQLLRYSRQLPIMGVEGQIKLLNSKVLVVGAGGLGSICLYYLVAAGVGEIGIVDSDVVELHNLHRQILHSTNDIGVAKVKSASKKLFQLNNDCQIKTFDVKLDKDNISQIVDCYNIVIDCTDNFFIKYLLNDYCVVNNIPLFYSSSVNFEGQIITIMPEKTACYRCIFPTEPKVEVNTICIDRCNDVGVLGSAVGIVGSIQVNEVLKYILGIGKLITNQVLLIDALNMNIQKIKVKKNENCPICHRV